MRARIENILHVSPDTFWQRLFFDEEYNARLYRELGFETYEVTALEDLGQGRIKRALRAEPPLHLPRLLKRHIQSRLFYFEEGIYDGSAQRWEFQSISNVAPEAAKVSGVIHTQAHPQGTLHVVELDVRISALGLGSIIEKVVEKNTRESYEVTTRFTNQYAAEKGLGFGL